MANQTISIYRIKFEKIFNKFENWRWNLHSRLGIALKSTFCQIKKASPKECRNCFRKIFCPVAQIFFRNWISGKIPPLPLRFSTTPNSNNSLYLFEYEPGTAKLTFEALKTFESEDFKVVSMRKVFSFSPEILLDHHSQLIEFATKLLKIKLSNPFSFKISNICLPKSTSQDINSIKELLSSLTYNKTRIILLFMGIWEDFKEHSFNLKDFTNYVETMNFSISTLQVFSHRNQNFITYPVLNCEISFSEFNNEVAKFLICAKVFGSGKMSSVYSDVTVIN